MSGCDKCGRLYRPGRAANNMTPTLGYESKSAAALGLKATGLTWKQVGEKLGISERDASSLACRARKRTERQVRTIRLSKETYAAFEREAVKRKLKTQDFVSRVMNLVAGGDGDDPLFAAILD